MEERERVGLHHRVGLVGVATLMILLVGLLAIAVVSTVQTLLYPTLGQPFPVVTPESPSPVEYADLRLALIGLDELSGLMTFRVSGYYTCLPPCSGSERIVFASVDTTEDEADRLPRSAAVVLSPGSPEIAQTIQLPVHGHALHYPFDSYELVLGVSVQRVSETGAPVALTPAEVANHLRLTVREALANFEMPAPVAVAPSSVHATGLPYDYLYGMRMSFTRPLAMQLTAIVLVCLIGTVVAFAVCSKPLSELLVGAGGMILALWGIRALLVPSNISYITLIDIALGLIMGLLLAAINFRGVLYLLERNHVRLPRGWSERGAPAARRARRAASAEHPADNVDGE